MICGPHLTMDPGSLSRALKYGRYCLPSLNIEQHASAGYIGCSLSVQKVSKPTTEAKIWGLYSSFSGLARVSEKLICILRALHEYVNFAAPDPYEFFRVRVIARMHVW